MWTPVRFKGRCSTVPPAQSSVQPLSPDPVARPGASPLLLKRASSQHSVEILDALQLPRTMSRTTWERRNPRSY